MKHLEGAASFYLGFGDRMMNRSATRTNGRKHTECLPHEIRCFSISMRSKYQCRTAKSGREEIDSIRKESQRTCEKGFVGSASENDPDECRCDSSCLHRNVQNKTRN